MTVPGGGRIGMALCPGKRQPRAVTGPWLRDLDADMAAVAAFGAALLISLMETEELADAGVPAETMRAAATARGIAWLHMPIADFQPPGEAFDAAWRAHGATVRDLLARGRNIVVHCRGGRGRSGTVAARLLREFGLSSIDAIAAVRAVNPLAMETAVQEDYVRTFGT